MIPTVNVKLLRDGAVLPSYGSAFAAGADLVACPDTPAVEIGIGETILIPTGLAPANKVGVIDSDYRGEILVALHNHSAEPQRIERGERIAQLVITPYLAVEFAEADTLEDTARGEGGFGSTGSK